MLTTTVSCSAPTSLLLSPSTRPSISLYRSSYLTSKWMTLTTTVLLQKTTIKPLTSIFALPATASGAPSVGRRQKPRSLQKNIAILSPTGPHPHLHLHRTTTITPLPTQDPRQTVSMPVTARIKITSECPSTRCALSTTSSRIPCTTVRTGCTISQTITMETFPRASLTGSARCKSIRPVCRYTGQNKSRSLTLYIPYKLPASPTQSIMGLTK